MSLIIIRLANKEFYHLQDDMMEWCYTNIGYGGWTWAPPNTFEGMKELWTIDSAFGTTRFTFKHEQDATAFKLKWSI